MTKGNKNDRVLLNYIDAINNGYTDKELVDATTKLLHKDLPKHFEKYTPIPQITARDAFIMVVLDFDMNDLDAIDIKSENDADAVILEGINKSLVLPDGIEITYTSVINIDRYYDDAGVAKSLHIMLKLPEFAHTTDAMYAARSRLEQEKKNARKKLARKTKEESEKALYEKLRKKYEPK